MSFKKPIHIYRERIREPLIFLCRMLFKGRIVGAMLNRSIYFPLFSPLNWILYTKVIVPIRNNPCLCLWKFTKPQTYIFTTIRVSMVTDDGAF